LPEVPEATALELYRKMTEIRLFEKRAYDLFMQNLVKGTTHLGTGQEAVAAGVSQAMNDDDYMFVTYRGHNHVLARGTPMTAVMAELLGRENGLMHGKGGSMHLLDVSRGILGAYAIIGAQLVIANGSAWSARYRGTRQVTVCFLGDGATNIGAFHEALNLAAVWQLPVIFICENNQYMEYTPIGSVTAVRRPAADRAASYGLEPVVVDGNDVEAVYHTAQAAIGRARDGGGPALIEALTYRHGGHSRADPGKYRPDAEVKQWLARDPLPAYRAVLTARGIDAAVLDAIDENAREAVDRATEEAKAGPEPSLELAATNVWADGGHAWRNLCPRGSGGSSPRASTEEGVGFQTIFTERTDVTVITYRDAVARGIAQEMRRDPTVVFLGEDVAAAGGVFKTTPGLLEQFGPERVRDTPISEQAILGAAMGAAMTGLRPIAEIMFSDFFAVCWDLIANEMAKSRYMSDGQLQLPLVVRCANGAGLRFGAQHSQSVENWAMAVPGLKVVAPSNPRDVIGLLAAAVRDPDPVMFFEHKGLYPSKGDVPDGEITDELGRAAVLRQGRDATIVALAAMVPRALAAAERLSAEDGIESTVIDVRSLVPLDTRTILAEVEKTGRLFTVEENPRLCGWGAEIVSIVAEEAFGALTGPAIRITTPHIPLPAADRLEDHVLPSVDRIIETVSKMC